MKIVVGLGNPGSQYEKTRHNVGWMALDRVAERAGWTGHARARDAAASVHGRLSGVDLMLAKPTTYMNLSGVAVRKLLARQRAPLDELLVVVDDFALPLGRLRLRADGGAGGHNGLRSIIDELASDHFARLRIGIGEPAQAAIDHVLSRFRPDEKALLDEVLDAAAEAIEDWAREGSATSANRWNGWRAVGVPVEPGPMAAETAEPEPGPGGIVRTTTGWRRLLGRK